MLLLVSLIRHVKPTLPLSVYLTRPTSVATKGVRKTAKTRRKAMLMTKYKGQKKTNRRKWENIYNASQQGGGSALKVSTIVGRGGKRRQGRSKRRVPRKTARNTSKQEKQSPVLEASNGDKAKHELRSEPTLLIGVQVHGETPALW